MLGSIRRDALPSVFFFQSCWSSGFAIKFTWFLQRRVFGSSNSPLGTPIESKWTRDPAIPKNAELAHLAVNLLPFFRFSHFFRKKQIAVVWSFRHLRHRSGGYLAAQRNWRQFYRINTFFVQSVELCANFLHFFLTSSIFCQKFAYSFTLWRRSVLQVQNCIRTFNQKRYFP